MSKVHLARSGFITKAALPSITRQRGTTTGTSNLMLFGAGKTTVANNTTFIDSSTNAFTVSRFGDTVHSGHNPFSTVSDGSAYFDGTGDYLTCSSSAFALGTGDFTIEMWIYWTGLPGSDIGIIGGLGSGSGSSIGIYNFGANITLLKTGGTTFVLFGSKNQLTINQWNHLAITRSGNSHRCFINGTLDTAGAVTSTADWGTPTTTTYIGSQGTSGYFNGYLSNIRVILGTALYTANFTPPTSALTAITNTQLLLLTDNYSIVNSTPTVLPVTIVGNTTISTAQFPTGMDRSIYFDGTGDYLTIPNNSAFNLGSSNFTIEAWVYPTVSGTEKQIITKYDAYPTGFEWNLDILSTGVLLFNGYGTSYFEVRSTTTIAINTWTHVAAVRNGATITIYINGVSSGTVSAQTFQTTTANVAVGRDLEATGATRIFTGYISNVRVVKGTAIYTSNFTPSAPLSVSISVPANVTNAIYGVNQLA